MHTEIIHTADNTRAIVDEAIDYALYHGEIPDYVDVSAIRTFIHEVAGDHYYEVEFMAPDEDINPPEDATEYEEGYSYRFVDIDSVLSNFNDAIAYGSNATEWAEEYIDSCYSTTDIPEPLRGYIDYERFGEDAETEGSITVHNGFVFYTSW